jgi:arylsulfatase/arylsulfatase A
MIRLSLLMAVLAAGWVQALPAAGPNVVIILTDDQGYGDLGCTGNPVLQTPNIDRLAAEGARLTRCYVSPVCTPTRASLMTGRYHFRTGAIDTYMGRALMDASEATLAELLRAAGYATGIFGKWHLGDNYPRRPQDQGFETVLVHRGGGLRQPSAVPGGEGYFDPILLESGRLVRREGYCTEIFFEAACAFVREAAAEGRPFLAYIAANAPHDPLNEVPQHEFEAYRKLDLPENVARVYAMVANIDACVGRLMQTLQDAGVARDTLILYLHDNGPAFSRYNAGLRGLKGSVYEGGIRTPLVAWWPGHVPAGRILDQPVAHVDILPTVLEACGVPLADRPPLDGRSMLALLVGAGEPWPERTLFAQWHRGNHPQRYRNFAAIRGRWKLLRGPAADAAHELYDLAADPAESRNVIEQHPEEAARLLAAYDAWFDDVCGDENRFAAQAIYVGSEHEDPVTLTRQDLRVEEEAPAWHASGAWHLRVVREGTYRFAARFNRKLTQAAVAMLQIGDSQHRTNVEAGSTECTWAGVVLPEGPCRLSAALESAEQGIHVWQVDVAGPLPKPGG